MEKLCCRSLEVSIGKAVHTSDCNAGERMVEMLERMARKSSTSAVVVQ